MLRIDKLKSANILAGDGDTWHAQGKNLGDWNVEEFPGRSIVSSPKTSETVASNETAAADDKVSSILSPG